MAIISHLREVQPCLLIRPQLLLQKSNKPESQPQTVTRIMPLPRKENASSSTEAHHLPERLYLHSSPAGVPGALSALAPLLERSFRKNRAERLAAFSGLPDRTQTAAVTVTYSALTLLYSYSVATGVTRSYLLSSDYLKYTLLELPLQNQFHLYNQDINVCPSLHIPFLSLQMPTTTKGKFGSSSPV